MLNYGCQNNSKKASATIPKEATNDEFGHSSQPLIRYLEYYRTLAYHPGSAFSSVITSTMSSTLIVSSSTCVAS